MSCRTIMPMLWLAAAGLAAADDAAGIRERIDAAMRRGVDFLILHQNPNGSWGGATRTKGLNIYAPLPGAHHAYRAGSTGLALSGLIEAKDPRPEAQASIRKGGDWCAQTLPELRRADLTTTYNVWGHAYGLRALTRLYRMEAAPEARQRWKTLAQEQVELANRYVDVNGGWGYLDLFDELATRKPTGNPTSFTTATMLLAMAEARDAMGLDLDAASTAAAIRSIRMQRNPDFTYAYSFKLRRRPRGEINRPAGSLSRSQACNACLRVWGDDTVDDAVLRDWADRFLAREGFLRNTRKRPVPHEGPFKIAGYFYYYGIYYFTESAKHLPQAEQAKYAEQLAETILPLQEKDGSWWDFPLYNYHQPYGTGYALMSLAWCRKVLAAAGTPAVPESTK